jgi:preprotein translocase subunit Sec63
MTATATKPDIHALMDAYAVLEAEHSANPAEIRRAYKRIARQHHPDRHPANSPEQRSATDRMAAVNAAYQLVRDAPLRHHRVSTGARPDDPWTDSELDAAIRRARHDRAFSHVVSAIAVLIYLFLPWMFSDWLTGPGAPLAWAVAAVYVTFALTVALGGGSSRVWDMIDVFKMLTRF